jgi:hypothetical protein
MTREAGKGDKQRPTDHDKFAENFDRIFGGGKHYKEGSLEKQVLEDQIAQATKEMEQELLGINNERR